MSPPTSRRPRPRPSRTYSDAVCFSRIDASVEDLTALAFQFADPSDPFETPAGIAPDSPHQAQVGRAATGAGVAELEASGPIR